MLYNILQNVAGNDNEVNIHQTKLKLFSGSVFKIFNLEEYVVCCAESRRERRPVH